MTALAVNMQDFTPFSARRIKSVPPRPTSPELTLDNDPAWVDSTRKKLEKLQALEPNWDGYGANPIKRDVIFFTQEVLNRIMEARTPVPHIAPMSHSGLMIEWHVYGIDVEIEIEKPGILWFSSEDSYLNDEYEGELASDLSKLRDWITKLTKRSISAAR